jgi:SAM-dependent methyltransferase
LSGLVRERNRTTGASASWTLSLRAGYHATTETDLYLGFPASQVPLLRCSNDAAAVTGGERDSQTLVNDTLRCTACGREYPVRAGIVQMLQENLLDDESNHERRARDTDLQASYEASTEQNELSLAEMIPMLEAAGPFENARVLELGAGGGRHTVPMAKSGAEILAVDFSIASLQRLAARVEPGWRIGLVQADCTRLEISPGAFGRVLSTLISNLPTPEHCDRMMRLAAKALAPAGKLVFSAHHFDLFSRIRRVRQSDRYSEGGIYRYLFKKRELERLTRQYFRTVVCRPIQIEVPLVRRLNLSSLKSSRVAERIPLLNQFGLLLLVEARDVIPPN